MPLPPREEDGDMGPLPEAQLAPEASNDNEEVSVATQTKSTGIIYPPPDIGRIVDKTAQFVAKNGYEVEKRIIFNNAGNVKFNFLSGTDPYHAYYQHRLGEYRAQKMTPGQGQGQEGGTEVLGEEKVGHSAQFRPVKKVPELRNVKTGEGLDISSIVDKTAQFVAKYGPEFEKRIIANNAGNVKFSFLSGSDPNHAIYQHRLREYRAQILISEQGQKKVDHSTQITISK